MRKFRTPCESQFAHAAKISHPQLCEKLCEIREGVQTHFAILEKFRKPYAKSNNLCENQWSLKSLFKPLQALSSFRTSHLPIAKASITLRRPSFHSFSPLDASRLPIWRRDPHRTYETQIRASHSISDMARIRGGHTDSSLSRNPKPRASSPQDSTSQAPEASTIPSSEGGCPLILLSIDTRRGYHRLHPGRLLCILRA